MYDSFSKIHRTEGIFMKNKNLLKGYIFVIISGALFGLMPLMTKYIYTEGVNSLSVVFLRNVLSLPVLGLLSLIQCKSLKVNLKAIPSITAVALTGCCLTPFLLFSSYNYMASSAATIFHFVYPALVVIGGLLFFKQKASAGTIISVIICFAGICMFYDPGATLDWRGCAIALLSGVAYAAYVLLLSVFKYKEISGFLFSFYISLTSSLVLLLICIVSGTLNIPDFALTLPTSLFGWGMCLLLAIVVNVGAVVLFQKGTFYIGGQRATILSTIEPITSVFVGVLFLEETITPLGWVGSFLVILASALIALFDAAKSKNEKEEETSTIAQ